MKNNKGFSLVELIIVIAIMVVLVGVLAPTYLQYVEKSRKSNDVSTVDSIINAIEVVAVDPECSDAFEEEGFQITLTNTANVAIKKADGNNSTATLEAKLTDIIGSDVKLKSSKWSGSSSTIVFKATANTNGKVTFEYVGNTAGNVAFSAYATSITKIPAVTETP